MYVKPCLLQLFFGYRQLRINKKTFYIFVEFRPIAVRNIFTNYDLRNILPVYHFHFAY